MWQAKDKEYDGKLCHSSYSSAWKLVDHMCLNFASKLRNLRLALSTDGVNPHKYMSSRHSCWHVILIIYNLPSWLFMMLSLLILGPHQLGKNIDVYLSPLVDDLKTLWEKGVETYDAHLREVFTLKAIIL